MVGILVSLTGGVALTLSTEFILSMFDFLEVF
jgi:hypothetical protein